MKVMQASQMAPVIDAHQMSCAVEAEIHPMELRNCSV